MPPGGVTPGGAPTPAQYIRVPPRHDLLAPERTILRHTISLQPAWEVISGRTRGVRRRFGRPPDLPPGERLVLVVATGPGWGDGGDPFPPTATLNGLDLSGLPVARSLAAPAGAAGLVRDVTDHLRPRNELVINGPLPAAEPAVAGRRHAPLPVACARVWLEMQGGGDAGATIGHP